MALYKNDIVSIDLETGSTHRSFINRTIGEGDALANRFGVRVYRNGEEVSLTGSSCTGYFIRSDGATVAITGAISGNEAYVDLPSTCYAIEGQFALAIKLTGGGVTGTMRIVDGVVANTSTDAAVDPGTIIPSVETLIETIEAAMAEIPADYTSFYFGIRGQLSSSDDVLNLLPGAYGVPSAAANKPANLPEDFASTAGGFVVALEKDNNGTNVSLAIQAYAKKVWIYTGFGWVEIATGNTVQGVYDYLYNNLLKEEMTHIAKGFYTPGNALSATKTQYKFLSDEGPGSVGQDYPDWYITNEIYVAPFEFFFITASAKYATHRLYNILDVDGNIIAYEEATSSTEVAIENKLVFMPNNAAKIQIASIHGADNAAIKWAVESDNVQKWTGKKWACIGDSLTAVNIRTTKHYHDYIAEKTGITVVNLGEGGTGYKREYAGEGPFIDRVSQIPLDADVVTIFGSGNDAIYTIGDPSDTGTDSLCSAINATIAAIFARKTTYQLGIVTPCPWESYNPADDTNWMARYSAAIVEICKRWGIPCLDLYHCSNLRPWDSTFRQAAYSKDDGGGVHPDETGHALMAPRFESFVESLLLH